GRRDPLKALSEEKEIHWWTPPTTQPGASNGSGQLISASPFVPTNELAELSAAVSALGLAQATATRPASATQPAAGGELTEAEVGLTVLARPRTQPAENAPAEQPQASAQADAP